MTVQVRVKRAESSNRRRRLVGHGRSPEQPADLEQPSEQPARALISASLADDRGPVRSEGSCNGQPLTNDPAVYHCQCGFVFEAPVSTTVGCPHCGATQAW